MHCPLLIAKGSSGYRTNMKHIVVLLSSAEHKLGRQGGSGSEEQPGKETMKGDKLGRRDGSDTLAAVEQFRKSATLSWISNTMLEPFTGYCNKEEREPVFCKGKAGPVYVTLRPEPFFAQA